MNDLRVAVELYATSLRLESRGTGLAAANVRAALTTIAHHYDVDMQEVIGQYVEQLFPLREEIYLCK